MQLIQSRNGDSIRILQDYEFDLAYGDSENDFELTMALPNHCCEEGDLVYIIDESLGDERGTEYGGIVDAIEIDTARNTVTYSGRTWHGILAKKVIEPPVGQDYYVVSGNALAIIDDVLNHAGLSDFFHVYGGSSPIEIFRYQFPRYVDVYSGLSDMLAKNGGKLKMAYDGYFVQVSAVWLTDYSLDDEWDSSQVTFHMSKSSNYTNHLICLGSGNLRNRRVIHLFLDQNGGIQPYASTDNPKEDYDYIFDPWLYRVLTGESEITEVLDYPSVQDQENYIALTEQPSDWADNYESYFYLASNGNFNHIEFDSDDDYTALTAQPADWAANFSSYFTSLHKPVEGQESVSYTQLSRKPADWERNWNQYYYYDSTQASWVPVDDVSGQEYIEQTRRPTDWLTNYSSYYQRKVNTEVVYNVDGDVAVEEGYAKTRKAGDGYETVTLDEYGAIPAWKRGRYFTRQIVSAAPEFEAGVYYKVDKAVTAPAWQANTYYSRNRSAKIPAFKSGVYYRLSVDHYANLVAEGIKRLEEGRLRMNSVSINLNLQGDYDIGDIVGARDETTGQEVWQPIVKKIVNISRSGKSINYKVGDTSK